MIKQLRIPLALLVLAFLVISAMAILSQQSTAPAAGLNEITMSTELLPELLPHGHTVGADAVTDDQHGVFVSSMPLTVPEDMWVEEFITTVENAGLDNLHHLVIARGDLKDPVCPGYASSIIYVTSAENVHEPFAFAKPYRLKLNKGTKLYLFAMLHNPEPPLGPGTARKNVRVKVTMKLDTNRVEAKKNIVNYRLHIGEKGCDPNLNSFKGEYFEVPAGAQNFISGRNSPWDTEGSYHTFTKPGTIVFMEGHVHAWEGGKELKVLLNNKPIHSFIPVQKPGAKPWEWVMPFKNPANISIKAGDTIEIQSEYDNPLPIPIKGAMGMMSFYFNPD